MGLDAVEIVMEIEEVFDISLEDSEVQAASTPRDLINLVMSKVAGSDATGCLTQRAFNLLRAALLRQLPLKRHDIAPEARLAELVQRPHRKVLLTCLAAELGTPPLPALVRPKWLVHGLVLGSILLSVTAAVMIFRHGLWEHRGALSLTTAGIGLTIACIAGLATRPLKTDFPPQEITVGDLSRWIVAHKRDLASTSPGKWTREQVVARVRDITIAQLDCAASYREDASFVQDLGLS